MSTIEKLAIRGIRCFGPTESEQAIISFTGSPVTLIVGQNGAGKTTIIECLKYMTTGEFPPNSKGGAFVIDPKLIGEREVKAVIKLKFTNVKGESVTCHRIIQSEQKATRLEQKQLDGSLEKRDKTTGEKVKITSRCTEINTEMITNLGVSKAILNHVIFCHQEESNWPLSEGKALKTKFDEIFASTRYSKALDNIRKVQKEQKQSCQEYATALKYLKEEKQKAEELRKRLTGLQKTVDSLKEKEGTYTEQSGPIEERLSKLKTQYAEVAEYKEQLAKLETSNKEQASQHDQLSNNIKHPFTGTMNELQLMFNQHETQQKNKVQLLNECEVKLNKVIGKENDLKQKINKLSEDRGRLESEEQHYNKAIHTRDNMMTKLSEDLGISGYKAGPFNNESIRVFISEVNEMKEKRRQDIHSMKSKLMEKETLLQSSLNELQDNCSRLKQKKEMKEKQLTQNEKDLINLNHQLSKIATANNDFDRIDLNLKQASKELKEYQEGVDIEQLERELSLLKDKKVTASDTLQHIQREMNIITQQSSARGAIENMQKDKQSKEQDYQREYNLIENELISLIGHIPSDDELESSIYELERTSRTSVAQGQSKLTKWRRDQLKLQTEMDGALKQVKVKKDHLNVINKEVESVCGPLSYEDKFKEVKDEMNSKEENLTAIKGSEAFFKECLNKARSNKKCPLCARGYESQEGLNSLITSIERRLTAKVPELVKTFQTQMNQLKSVHEKLLQLTPQLTEVQSLRTKEIPSLESEINEKKALLDKLNTDTNEAESQLTINQKQLEQLRELRPRVTSLTQTRKSLNELESKINNELSKLGGESVRSHAVVQRELQKTQMECDELGRKMDNKRQEIGTCQRSVCELEKKVNYYQQEQLSLQKQVQERQNIIKKKEEITATNQELQRDIQAAERQLKPLDTKLALTLNEKEESIKEREEKERISQSQIHQLDTSFDSINSSILEINKLEAKRFTGNLEQCKQQLAELSEQINIILSEKKKLEDTKDDLRSSLANSKIRHRELEDNIELLKINEKLIHTKREIEQVQSSLKQHGLDQYERDMNKLQLQSNELSKKLGLLRGDRLSKEGELRSVQRELETDMYQSADKRHREMYIKLKTTEIAITDLDKFYKALDRAIMQYHSYKMSEINKIIRELWIKTYKGGDIDTIEIRSDDDLEGTKATGRRTYNYRVVMVKGDTALDMRGRCSAGQKVITSIIIRLALAESFCLHCGLLALDEPTTNLDSENVEGLALALSDIIRERSRQRNFQLIIITHDLSFVEQLGRSEFVGEYHLVKKEEGACSTVRKVPINELAVYN